jgi:predicted lipid-binding transport protein (Tim44 family)
MTSTTRIAISGVISATLTAASTVAGVMLGHKYMGSRLGGGILGFFVLAPITNAIAFPFHGPGAMAAMRTMREVDASMREPPIASLQQGSGASSAERYTAAASERQNAAPHLSLVRSGATSQVA